MHFDRGFLAFPVDACGVPAAGRGAEYASLVAAGYENLSRGRLFEGHVNALELVGRLGTDEQRVRAIADAAAGRLFGTWNTQDADGVHIVAADGGFRLRGRKTFCSGAGRVARGLISAAWPDGQSQLVLVAMDAVETPIDRDGWQPLGMVESESYAIRFDGVAPSDDDLIGKPGDYEAAPWFLGGALRFVAVQAGGIARVRDETARFLDERARDGDPYQRARLGELAVAAASAEHWAIAGASVWRDFDASPNDARAEAVVALADLARLDVERAAFVAIERAERCVGARGLLEPEPFAKLVRDLAMYVRQPGPDATLARIGSRAAESVRRKTASASVTGTRAYSA